MGVLIRALVRYVSRLRFPWLFALTAALFLLDLLVPDVIPLADEILLALLTALLGSLRKRPPRGGNGERRLSSGDGTKEPGPGG